MILDADRLNLPRKYARKFKNQKVDLVETAEGLLIRPVAPDIVAARGLFRGSKFTTAAFRREQAEELEREG